jgi:putative phage-type endonuclease
MNYETTPNTKTSQASPSPETDRAGWLKWRKAGIGGSDAAAIMGLDPWKSPLDIYIDKTTDTIDESTNLILERGLALEPLVAERYARETGRKLRRQPGRIHPEHDFIRCSIDRQILTGKGNPTAQLEIKTANSHVFRKFKMDGIPEKYIVQIQHNLMVWGYDWSGFAVLCPDTWEMIHFDVERDDLLCEAIKAAEIEFWQRVIDRTPPEVDQRASVKVPEVGGELTRIETDEFRNAVAALREARQIAAEAGEILDSAKAKVQAIMADTGAQVAQGAGMRFCHTQQAGRRTFNKKALQAAHPEIDLDQFTQEGKPFYSFRMFDVGEVE